MKKDTKTPNASTKNVSEKFVVCPKLYTNKCKFIRKNNVRGSFFTNIEIAKLLIKHLNVAYEFYDIDLPENSIFVVLVENILHTIYSCYEGKYKIADGANLAMTTIDKNINKCVLDDNEKKVLKRNWRHVAQFMNNERLILVLRDIVYKSKRESEKDIRFEVFNNRCLWLSEKDNRIDDIIVIIIASMLSILNNKTEKYYTNDKFSEHSEFINILKRKYNSSIQQVNINYSCRFGFSI